MIEIAKAACDRGGAVIEIAEADDRFFLWQDSRWHTHTHTHTHLLTAIARRGPLRTPLFFSWFSRAHPHR